MRSAAVAPSLRKLPSESAPQFEVVNADPTMRKVSGTYAPLEGAEFEILRYDRTRVSGTDAGGAETAVFTSGANGVYFVGQLPFGTYYLHETGYPDGAQQNGGDGWWYTLTVSSEGITCTEQQETEPDDAVIQDAATQP